ncbi:MAG: response regulator [Bellilinea sp.]|nr:response regulator [Bellilinea sp.]
MARILVAEDERDIRDLIVFILQIVGGHEVIPVGNGEEAVKKAPEVNPDLIMMDVRMPRMTGFQACRALRENPATAHYPVVFLTAKGQDDEIMEGKELGALGYILKPFEPEGLVEQVGAILRLIGKA